MLFPFLPSGTSALSVGDHVADHFNYFSAGKIIYHYSRWRCCTRPPSARTPRQDLYQSLLLPASMRTIRSSYCVLFGLLLLALAVVPPVRSRSNPIAPTLNPPPNIAHINETATDRIGKKRRKRSSRADTGLNEDEFTTNVTAELNDEGLTNESIHSATSSETKQKKRRKRHRHAGNNIDKKSALPEGTTLSLEPVTVGVESELDLLREAEMDKESVDAVEVLVQSGIDMQDEEKADSGSLELLKKIITHDSSDPTDFLPSEALAESQHLENQFSIKEECPTNAAGANDNLVDDSKESDTTHEDDKDEGSNENLVENAKESDTSHETDNNEGVAENLVADSKESDTIHEADKNEPQVPPATELESEEIENIQDDDKNKTEGHQAAKIYDSSEPMEKNSDEELGGEDESESAHKEQESLKECEVPDADEANSIPMKNERSVVPEYGEESEEITIVEADTQSLSLCEDDESDLTVSVVTWNLAELSVIENETTFLKKFRKTRRCAQGSEDGSDIVLISGQECENIKPRRSEGHRSREYRRLMIKMLGKKYVPLAIHSLGGIQFGLFCKRSILSDVEFCSIADVTCGIGNVFHNKGAVAAFLKLKARERASDSGGPKRAKSVTMLFVTAHMAAHVNNVEARNMDYWRIASELEAQAPPQFLLPKNQDSPPKNGQVKEEGSGSYLMESVDRVFFCGDLNYRLDLPREVAEFTVSEIKRLIDSKATEAIKKADKLRLELMRHDQLHHAISENAVFPGFSEGKISFAPTFKFDKGTNDYDTSHKQRIPAWTDRVLFKPFGVRVLEYMSEEDAMHSDHRPVHATFRVSMQARELLQGGKKNRSRTKPSRSFQE